MNILLDIARGIAALSVFLYHIKGVLAGSIPFLGKIASYGYLGVPLFFVISGYVITSSADTTIIRKKSSNSFLKRRFLRIYPPFWVSVLVVLSIPYIVAVISALKSGHFYFPEFVKFSYLDWVRFVTLTKVFMSNNGDLQGEFNQVNSVYWTLAIEFQFYLCIYVALVMRRYFLYILVLITATSVFQIFFPQQINAGLFIHFWPMFAIGIALYYSTKIGLTMDDLFPRYGRVLAAVGVSIAVVSIAFLAYRGSLAYLLSSVFPSSSIGFAFLSGCVLWLGMPLEAVLENGKNGQNFIFKYLIKAGTFLGVISYSLYLLHGKVADLPGMFARQIVPMDNALYPSLMIGGTVALCFLFYRYVERPFMSSHQRRIYQSALAGSTTARS